MHDHGGTVMKHTAALRVLLPSFLSLLLLFSSCAQNAEIRTPADTDRTGTQAETVEEVPYVLLAGRDIPADFTLVYNADDAGLRQQYLRFRDAAEAAVGERVTATDMYLDAVPYEILYGADRRESYRAAAQELSEGEYSITVQAENYGIKIILAFSGRNAAAAVMDRFLAEFIDKRTTEKEIRIPMNTSIKDKAPDYAGAVITSQIGRLRDPCIVIADGVYYAYGTGWVCYRNTTGSLAGEWEYLGMVAEIPADAETNYWAPEVHRYKDAYYMFTTYKSRKTGHRGCTVMKSDSPEGPFVEISDGHVTPTDWDSIDGTLYVDRDGQPWMVFVHEWTSTDDGIGRMAAAKLSDDLSSFVSEPVELFRADDPAWTNQAVTDGCYLYDCADGTLLMIWSNFEDAGYCVGIARSDNGRVDGSWSQDTRLLYSKNLTGTYDGGHGMIFEDTDGQLYLSINYTSR